MPTQYAEKNRALRERLTALVNQLTNEELSQPVGDKGWTVAGYLAHLAFWDQRALLLLLRWQKDGVGPSELDVDLVNEVARVFLVELPERVAANITLKIAKAIDEAIESLSPEMLAKVESNGKTIWLDRSAHRQHHLEQIEDALGRNA